jgi:hypothetical protein
MNKDGMQHIIEGQLDRLEGNLVRGRSGEQARLYRLRIDGRWYFCQASDFNDSKRAGATLRHARLPARVTAAPFVVNGRHRLFWLRLHDTDESLEAIDPLKRIGLFALLALLAAALVTAMYLGWPWVNQWPTTAFVMALPVILVLMVVTLLCVAMALFGVAEAVSMLRPGRFRARREYLSMVGARTHGG